MSWVFLPLCRCSLDAEGSTSGRISVVDSEPSPTAKPSLIAKPASCPKCGGEDWIRPRWMTMLEPSTQEALGDALMSWQVAIRANRIASQEKEKDYMTNAGSGHTLSASSKSAGQDSSCARTSQELFPPEDLLPSWKTWKAWATKHPHTKFPLLRLGHGTSESASSLLPTLKKSDASHGGPNQRDSKGYPALPGAVRLMPTLIKRDTRGPKSAMQGKNQTGTPSLVAVIGGTLNPEWAEWYMGVLIGWTELEPWATSWFHNKRCPLGRK